ncbi:hypothetical protein [Chromohalobacter israelensis]|uniref:Transmembrane protein n=1 Tax=Chromohalobacter israelensis (strain ATCC BAA-138 / DSM 3043 / CIP 106854 / NCIMB 13768 / 1H11) TaxID=290398 RepID=Q1QZ61_CHRI1|nr:MULTISPECIES: hypothetical protein [Chromohalobacter]ABE58247.1 conserved hypothetical protein [Chromohalobacter salexigens DSM 3043]MBZ5875689.1 hypothetical protein [Chromohalobacter salexigens]MDF9433306.1 hypothetical protein [Chromohalobacter israelensis]MDO0944321.1 hypothetical protein [Chromohalobacter salexigens]NWO55874.1 hypothetical protein [Chromohalobacter salexigens]
MLALARWVMRGTPQAAVTALIAALIPWLFWLSAAVAALVTLRRGLGPGLPVLIAAALPAGWWWVQGDAVPLASVLLVTLMATILRARLRWGDTLIAGTLVCAVLVQIGIFLPPGGAGPMLEQVRQNSAEVDGMLTELSAQGVSTEQLAGMLISGITGLVVLLAAIACLALARSWQAGLYNPGGFREEFHALRLSAKELLLLVGVGVLGLVFAMPMATMLVWVPLLVAGVALVHGWIGMKGMSGFWLVGFYALLLTTWPTILIVLLLAVVDTFADFRARLARNH